MTPVKQIKDCILRQVAGESILIPTGAAAVGLNGMITLSETAVFVWKLLEREQSFDSLLAAVLERYEVEKTVAAAELRQTLGALDSLGLLEHGPEESER